MRYVEGLNARRRPGGQPWTKSSRASAYTTLRKLQSTMRNNVNTNYGQREKLLDVIEDLAEAEFRSLNSQIYRLLVEAISARKLATPPVPKED